jgi:miniconductance mechanosensitive channel
MDIDVIKDWFAQHPVLAEIAAFIFIMLVAYISYFITKNFIIRVLGKLIRKSKIKWDDVFLDEKFLRLLADIIPVLVFYNLAFLVPSFEAAIKQISIISILILAVLLLSRFLDALNIIFERSSLAKGRSIKGIVQIIKIFLYIIGIIFLLSILMDRSPWFLVSGIGAMTAVVLLIFRDTILSFVAGLQISSNDLVRVGDWIEVPAFNADGDVIDIALHTIKIQNWDKTISVIPAHKLIEVSFKNWRGMQQTGGRRIKRALYIDQSSIKFCDHEMLEKYSQFQLLKDYIKEKQKELIAYNTKYGFTDEQLVNGRRMTNIGTFRAYIIAYLKHHNSVHQGLTSMVRQLSPGPEGLPLEIYVFTNNTDWIRYEAIQSDIFDHLLSVVSQFDLRIFQIPSGKDFSNIGK